MTNNERGKNSRVFDVFDYIQVSDNERSTISIVRKEALRHFIASVPNEYLENFLETSVAQIPEVTEPRFGAWVAISCKQLGLTQKEFAAQLTETKLVTISQSDISNVCQSKSRLTEGKLTSLRGAIQTLLRLR